MSFKCPTCQTTLYSRVHRLCQPCGAVLPAELLLPEAEIRHFEQTMEQQKRSRFEADRNIDVRVPDISNFVGC
jgi:transcription initiation factor TFIIIB Brf1 subunit/transcription initiation factor TFIIB